MEIHHRFIKIACLLAQNFGKDGKRTVQRFHKNSARKIDCQQANVGSGEDCPPEARRRRRIIGRAQNLRRVIVQKIFQVTHGKSVIPKGNQVGTGIQKPLRVKGVQPVNFGCILAVDPHKIRTEGSSLPPEMLFQMCQPRIADDIAEYQ